MNDEPMPTGVPPDVLAHLRDHHTLTLATASRSGTPHAATLLYAADDLTLYCWSRLASLTLRHVEQNPNVAFTIDRYTPDWSETTGIQGTGECRILRTPTEIDRVVSLVRRKFPAAAGPPAADLVFFGVVPTEIQFIDNQIATATAAPAEGRTRQRLDQAYHRQVVYRLSQGMPHQHAAPTTTTLDSVRVPAGTVIVRQGTPADAFFIIADGEVAVLREEGGHSRQIATLTRGQFFGEMAIVRDIPRTATVRALTPTTLLTLGREAFRDLLGQSLGTTADFDRIVRQRLEELGMMPPPAAEPGP